MNITCTRRFQFCAGHRLLGHEGGCANLHGHNYVAEVEIAARELDSVGRVIDFSVVKKIVGLWINTHWDHAFLVNAEDCEVIASLTNCRSKRYTMADNPTAENMAAELLFKANELLAHRVERVVSVTILETPTCYATVRV